jgi:DedD protein
MAKIESEDEFKRQMRRRLVGAVALVTALVVILPMLLENSPKPQQGSLELRIPDKDKSGAFTSQMVVAESAPDVTPLPPPEAEQAAASAPVPEAPEKPAAAAPAKPAHKAAHDKDKAVKSATAKPVSTKPAHAKAVDASGGASKPEAHTPGFAVQVGAFSHAASARELQGKLNKQGWHAYTRKAGEAVRVRVGPFPGRAEAERALGKLKAQGHPATVVTEP